MTFEAKNRKKDYIKSENDFYITPRLAVLDILEKEIINLPKDIKILDAGCGDGAISKVLKEKGFTNITSIDLVDRGYEGTIITDIFDFEGQYDLVITNPPYSRGLINDFMEKCLSLTKKGGKVISLCRIQLLETMERFNRLFNNKNFKCAWIYIYSNRIACTNPLKPLASKSMMNYAWFVWDNTHTHTHTTISWLNR